MHTFMKRGAQSLHLGGLFGYGFGDGEDKKHPLGDNTYMSSGTILSFWTPDKHIEKCQLIIN